MASAIHADSQLANLKYSSLKDGGNTGEKKISCEEEK
jgi:hypothetical protein